MYTALNRTILDAILKVYDPVDDPYYRHRTGQGIAIDLIEWGIASEVARRGHADESIRILEIGGGLGQLSAAVGLLGYHPIVVVDSAQIRHEACRRLVTELGLDDRITAARTRFPGPGVPDADLILCTNTIGWWDAEEDTELWATCLPVREAIIDLERFGRHRATPAEIATALRILSEIGFMHSRVETPGLASTSVYHLEQS